LEAAAAVGRKETYVRPREGAYGWYRCRGGCGSGRGCDGDNMDDTREWTVKADQKQKQRWTQKYRR